MKTLLVLAPHPQFAEAVRASLNPDDYRVIHRADVNDSEAILGSHSLDAVLFDAELDDVRTLWTVERLRRRVPRCPILVFIGSGGWELADDIYHSGVDYVLPKPVRRRLLQSVLDRLWQKQTRERGVPSTPRSTVTTLPARAPAPAQLAAPSVPTRPATALPSLEALSGFSAIISNALSAEALLQQFLLLLREMLSINRAAIFLRHMAPMPGAEIESESSRVFRYACAMGLPRTTLEHFELAFDTGIGGYLSRTGRVLTRRSEEALADADLQNEFEVLGAEVAVPILDREQLIGIAAFDGRVTGEALTGAELGSIFHLLEQVGLALKNVWLHDQVAANHHLLAGILRDLGSACVVIDRDLRVLHANKAARNYFSRRRAAELEFNDLPALLGSKVYQVLNTGSAISPFKFQPPDSPESIYQVTIVPSQSATAENALPASVLLMVEDRTQLENVKRLEIEAAGLQQVKTIGGRLAHEINNAVMPLALIQQELEKRVKDRDISGVFGDSVKRIARRGQQMRVLAQDNILTRQTFSLSQVVQDAFEEAQKNHSGGAPKLESEIPAVATVGGDREAIKLAFAEILLNAFQANAKEPKVAITSRTESDVAGAQLINLEIKDNGPGFTPEALENALKPFFTTRTVGLGVGLSVAEKVISLHRGKLSIANASGGGGVVRVTLPLETVSAVKEKPAKRESAA